MAFIDDLKVYAVANGFSAATLFRSTNAKIPTGVGPYTSFISTGGPTDERIQNDDDPGYEKPTAQVLTRALDYDLGWAENYALLRLFRKVRNQTINGVWYREIRAMQSHPIDLANDNVQRSQIGFNLLGDRSPS